MYLRAVELNIGLIVINVIIVLIVRYLAYLRVGGVRIVRIKNDVIMSVLNVSTIHSHHTKNQNTGARKTAMLTLTMYLRAMELNIGLIVINVIIVLILHYLI
tara:strand:+ start:305 stop:610 length:306 start_codon:yes stop_codon:yes gene_type:complete